MRLSGIYNQFYQSIIKDTNPVYMYILTKILLYVIVKDTDNKGMNSERFIWVLMNHQPSISQGSVISSLFCPKFPSMARL